MWGEGYFGKFYTPHKIKSGKTLEIADFNISRGGIAPIISRQGTVYTWGPNDVGQLGHGDFNPRQTPQRVRHLEGKRVTMVGLGDDFCIALGLTLPSKEINRLAKSSGILRLKPEEESKRSINRIRKRTPSKSSKERVKNSDTRSNKS